MKYRMYNLYYGIFYMKLSLNSFESWYIAMQKCAYLLTSSATEELVCA